MSQRENDNDDLPHNLDQLLYSRECPQPLAGPFDWEGPLVTHQYETEYGDSLCIEMVGARDAWLMSNYWVDMGRSV